MKMRMLSGLVIGGLVVSVAQGQSLRYRTSGPWEAIAVWDPAAKEGAGDWTGAGWMKDKLDPTLAPGMTDTVRANWGDNTVTLDYETTVKNFQIGVDESGTFHIKSGGTLNTVEASTIGNNNLCTGTMIIDAGGVVNNTGWLKIGANAHNNGGVTGVAVIAGTLNITGHLWMAASSGGGAIKDTKGNLTINAGGVVNVGENIGLGTVNAVDPSGGTATITVNDGGTLNLHHWSSATAEHDGSIQDGSVLVINSGGKVVVGGHRIAAAEAWIAEGKITTDAAELVMTYDAAFDQTTITTPPAPLTLEIANAGADFLLAWNGQSDSLYRVLSTADLSEDIADWDLVREDIAGSSTSVAMNGAVLFYRVEEYPKPPAVVNESFEDPGGIDTDDFDLIGDPWVDDGLGLASTWNPEDPTAYNGKPAGPNVAHIESDGDPTDTAFGISQVLTETFAEGTDYTVSVRVGRSHLYEWPGYRIELWADGTLIASDDDLTTTAPAAGTWINARLSYAAGTVTGLTPGGELEIRLQNRNANVEGADTGSVWAVDFDNVQFRSTQP